MDFPLQSTRQASHSSLNQQNETISTRGTRVWHSADGFEMKKWREFLNFFRKKEICSVGISVSLVVLHCIISQMSRSQPCDGDTEARKNLI
jgi:hypothetical protein